MEGLRCRLEHPDRAVGSRQNGCALLRRMPLRADAGSRICCEFSRRDYRFAVAARGRVGRTRAIFFGQSWESLPDVPAVGEFVPGYEASSWHGLPKATPAEIIDRLNNQINAALADPIMKARFAELGGIILGARPSTLASSLPKKPKRGPT